MTKKALSVVLAAVCVFGALACKPSKKKTPLTIEQQWYRYISAYTTGTISRKSEIRVLFVNNVAEPGPAAEGLFDLSPSIAGKVQWRTSRELVFTPAGELRPGTDYKAVLQVGRILKLPKAFEKFPFAFSVIRPEMEITVSGLDADDPSRPNMLALRGLVDTSDDEDPAAVGKVLEADQEGAKLTVEWSRPMNTWRLFYFTVRGIERREQASEVRLAWDGAPLKIDNRGTRSVPIPALGEFELTGAEAVTGSAAGGGSNILLRFSDVLERNQNLQGLIRVGSQPLTFTVEGSMIRVYSSRDFAGTVDVSVSPGIRNFLGRRLKKGETRQLTFQSIRPQVRFVGRGAILPQKDRLTVPIEAVNLKSIQVAAFQVYSGNMAQFLQVNSLESSAEMGRVGRFLWRKTVPLSDDPEVTGRWSRYHLDVTSLFREHPGSLFSIVLTFNRGNSAYPCAAGGKPVPPEPEVRNQDDAGYYGYSNWDYAEEDYRWNQTDWLNRNDPCSDSYYSPRYNNQAVVSRNFLASNVGLVAKLEERGTLHVVTTDIGTARPLTGVKVRAFNFQNQPLAEGTSDANGFTVLNLPGPAFYVSAESGGDTGYLRLSGDAALPMSHFDVGGEVVEKGIKGVIYGERGVWRPGDTLFLTFVLFDRDKVLPQDFPVVMEIRSPQGQLVQTVKPQKTVAPFYAFQVTTDESAPTGNWRATVLLGGQSFGKTLKIETVVPNRIKVDFQTGRDVLARSAMPVEASLTGTWLHGAPAANLKFDVTPRLAVRPTRFDKFTDFAFDDPARDFSGGDLDAVKGVLDAQGKAKVRLDFAPKTPSPGMLDATFVTRIFEESGDFSIDTVALPFHPYTSYVGVRTPRGDAARGMLLTDTNQTVDIATVDDAGRPVSRDKVIVSVYKIEWRWWWDRSGESLAQYVSSAQTVPLFKGEIATKDGLGSWTFQVRYPDWGRYLVRAEDPESGHASGRIVYIDWPGWAGRAREEKGPGATRLNFTADKARYQVGEKAVIFLPETVQGRALVSIENGSSVLQKMWVPTEKGQNKFEVELTNKMTPNVYVHVTLIQPHRDKVSDTPIRLYGAIPIVVDDPATELKPVLRTADEIRPKEKFKVEVKEKDGRPMTYTVAVVDEGLLSLTRFGTPNLRRDFYNREALGVRTWDLFDEVVEAYGAELSRILALGGGEEGLSKEQARKPRRFPPVVLFAGPFELKAGETASHELLMPQYFGAVRVMVVAGRDGAFGSAEKSVPVRRDLMILPTLPRVARPGELVEMPIAVFVTNPALKDVAVSVGTNAMFQVQGEAAKTLTFAKPGDDIVTFSLKTADAVGQGEVRFKASAGGERVEDSIAIEVLGSNPLVTNTTRLEVKPGQTATQAVVPFGIENTNQVTVEASTMPPLNLEKRVDYLIQFPHGCLEQTLSVAFPQLYLKSLVRLEESQKKAIERHVLAAIDKLAGFQTLTGAFSYWPGGFEAHDWTTTYAGYFLLEAARLGYHVSDSMLNKWKAHQKMLANGWTTGPAAQQLMQAFRLFSLALARDPDLGAMNRLREAEGLDGTAAVELAAAFQVTGQAEAADDLLKRADLKFPRYRDDHLTFGSDFRDRAMVVRALVLAGRNDRAKPIVEEIAKTLATDLWLSTQETAFALMAVASFYGNAGIKPFRMALAWDQERPVEIETSEPLYKNVWTAFPAKGRTLTITNPGDMTLYVNVYRRGMPPAGGEPESANDVSVTVTYRDMKMNPVDIAGVSQGLDLVAEVRVKNLTQRTFNNLVLTHLVAAGFQIKNPRMVPEGGAAPAVDYQDIRDDRVFTYFKLDAGTEKTFLVVLNASYRGRFYQPGPAVEAMYDGAVHANTKGQWVEIVQ